MMDKNYQILKEIKGLNELLDDLNKKNIEIKEYDLRNILSDNHINGVHFADGSNRRNFCECGYVSYAKDSNNINYCPNCNKKNFVNILTRKSEFHLIETAINNPDSIEDLEIILRYIKWNYTISEDRATIELHKEIIEEQTFNKTTDDLQLLNNTFDNSSMLISLNINETKLAKEIKRIFPKIYSFDKGLLLVLMGHIIKNPDILEKWDKPEGIKILESFNHKHFNLYWFVTEEETIKMLKIIKNYSIEKALEDEGINKRSYAYKLFLKDRIEFEEIKSLNDKLEKYKNHKDYNFLLEVLDQPAYSAEKTYKYIDTIMDKDILEYFKVYHNKNKHIYINTIFAFSYDLEELRKSEEENEEDIELDLLINNSYNLLKGINILKKNNFPEEKLILFEYYIKKDPLKALEIISNKRKLTKKQIKEEAEILKKIVKDKE